MNFASETLKQTICPADLSHSSVERIRNDDPKHSYPVVTRGWVVGVLQKYESTCWCVCLVCLNFTQCIIPGSTSWTPLQSVDCKTPWPWFHSIPIYPCSPRSPAWSSQFQVAPWSHRRLARPGMRFGYGAMGVGNLVVEGAWNMWKSSWKSSWKLTCIPCKIGGWILGLQFWTKGKTGRDWKGEKTTPTSADQILPKEICVQWLSNGSEKISQGVELKTRSFTQYVYKYVYIYIYYTYIYIYIYITRIYIYYTYIYIYTVYRDIIYIYIYIIDLLCTTYN